MKCFSKVGTVLERKLIGKNDLILIGVLLACLAVIGIALLLMKKDGKEVVVSVDGKEVASFSLDKDLVYEIEGYEGGKNILTIESGVAYMSDASCPDKLCMHMGKISNVGQSVICLPNRVVVEIRGNEADREYDA